MPSQAVSVQVTVKGRRKLVRIVRAGTSRSGWCCAKIVLAEAKVRPHKVRGWLRCADDPGSASAPGRSAAEHARYLERHPQPEPQTALPEAA